MDDRNPSAVIEQRLRAARRSPSSGRRDPAALLRALWLDWRCTFAGVSAADDVRFAIDAPFRVEAVDDNGQTIIGFLTGTLAPLPAGSNAEEAAAFSEHVVLRSTATKTP